MLARLLPERPLRSYPALLSTEADALAWARAGAVSGSIVVADYQASPRGRAGLPWQMVPGVGLGFSVVLRPSLPAEREGWLYSVISMAFVDAMDVPAASIEWPDELHADGRIAAFGVATDVDAAGVRWAVVNVLVDEPVPPRGPLLARIVEAIQTRIDQEPGVVLEQLRPRCATLGRVVRARLIPMGPAGVQVEGMAADLLADGALLIETGRGRRVAVLPQHLGMLDGLGDREP